MAGGLPYKGLLKENDDLNTLLSDSIYGISMASASGLLNYPKGASTYGLLAIVKAKSIIMQEITIHPTCTIYRRIKYTGAKSEWSEWVKINANTVV